MKFTRPTIQLPSRHVRHTILVPCPISVAAGDPCHQVTVGTGLRSLGLPRCRVRLTTAWQHYKAQTLFLFPNCCFYMEEESVESTPKSQPDNPTSSSVRRKGNTPKYFVCLISKIQMFHDLRSSDILCQNLISFRV